MAGGRRAHWGGAGRIWFFRFAAALRLRRGFGRGVGAPRNGRLFAHGLDHLAHLLRDDVTMACGARAVSFASNRVINRSPQREVDL